MLCCHRMKCRHLLSNWTTTPSARRSSMHTGQLQPSPSCPRPPTCAVMCGTSLLFTLYHTVKFAGDLRRHLQVRQCFFQGHESWWAFFQGESRGGRLPHAGLPPCCAPERHGRLGGSHGRASPPPSQCRSILTLPAVRSEARADWRALLRYAWNALFWAGFVCWWVTGLRFAGWCCWEAQQRKASRRRFQVEFIHGCQPRSPAPCPVTGMPRLQSPPLWTTRAARGL